MSNEFLKFCETDNGTNLLTQGEYDGDAQRLIGNAPGVARLKLVNKAARQAAFVTSNIAQYMENVTGNDVLDDGDDSAFLATMALAFGTLLSVVSKTTTYTIAASDGLILCSSSGGAFTVTLPSAVGLTGKQFRIKKTDSSFNKVTIAADGAELIDGVSTKKLCTENESWTICSDGVGWKVLDHKCNSSWKSFTGSGSWSTNTTYSSLWRRVGDNLELQYAVNLSGAPNAVALTLNIVSGLVVDTAKSVSTTAYSWMVGEGIALNSGVLSNLITAFYETTTTFTISTQQTMGGANPVNNQSSNSVSATTPFSFGVDDKVIISISVPIVDWEA